MIRSIVAIVVGFVAIAVLSIGTTMALHAAGIMPGPAEPLTDPALLALAQAYVAVFAIAGCFLTAALAPNRPMRHALVLGVLGLAFNLFNAVSRRGLEPDWSLALGIVLTMPYAWIGGKLREMQLARQTPGLAS
ncbi:MAG TPA: hypothetical protein VFJ82_07560 [Longimicrobium sp.]|nr:hypothetical protein [Longimicrobium sp.]